jgi:hypothetical protein
MFPGAAAGPAGGSSSGVVSNVVAVDHDLADHGIVGRVDDADDALLLFRVVEALLLGVEAGLWVVTHGVGGGRLVGIDGARGATRFAQIDGCGGIVGTAPRPEEHHRRQHRTRDESHAPHGTDAQ